MANTSFTQQSLAAAPQFLIRVRAQLITQAFVVLAETPVTNPPNTAAEVAVYQARRTFAKQVLQDSNREATRIVSTLVMRTNLMAGITSYDFSLNQTVTDVIDAGILSQLATDWSTFANVA